MVMSSYNAQLQLNLLFTTNIIYAILHIFLHNKWVIFTFIIKQSMVEERDKTVPLKDAWWMSTFPTFLV